MAQVAVFNISDLETIISKVVRDALTEIRSVEPAPTTPEYLTRIQTADTLHISLSTLDTYTRKGILKAKRVGKRILYSSNEINDAMIDKVKSVKHKMK